MTVVRSMLYIKVTGPPARSASWIVPETPAQLLQMTKAKETMVAMPNCFFSGEMLKCRSLVTSTPVTPGTVP